MSLRALVAWVLMATLGGCAVAPPSAVPPSVPTRPYAGSTLADIRAPAALRNGGAGLQIPGVHSAMLLSGFWTARIPDAGRVLQSADAVAALNANTWAETPTLYVLEKLPSQVAGGAVTQWIEALAASAKPELIDAQAQALGEARVQAMRANTRVAAVPANVTLRWANVVTRADLRSVPDATRAYRKAEDIIINIDRLQESALFPGMAVVVMHESADGQWVFVNAYNYRAWMRKDALQFVSREAALARNAEVQPVPLPYSRANLIRTAFQYLGEPYGWGHADGTRDCSGFVSEVYAALGVVMPRNTGDQRDIPNFHATRFTAKSTHAERMQAINAALPGDLIFIPGHVMMVLGRWNGLTYVIHDTPGVRIANRALPLYGVSVTPLETLEPLSGDSKLRYIDMIQAITRPLP